MPLTVHSSKCRFATDIKPSFPEDISSVYRCPTTTMTFIDHRGTEPCSRRLTRKLNHISETRRQCYFQFLFSAAVSDRPKIMLLLCRGATTFSKFGSNSLIYLGYYYPSTEKIDRSTQSGAVGYIITLYSSKSYVINWGSVQILGRFGPHRPSVVAPILL